jgi:hypothetical protein
MFGSGSHHALQADMYKYAGGMSQPLHRTSVGHCVRAARKLHCCLRTSFGGKGEPDTSLSRSDMTPSMAQRA